MTTQREEGRRRMAAARVVIVVAVVGCIVAVGVAMISSGLGSVRNASAERATAQGFVVDEGRCGRESSVDSHLTYEVAGTQYATLGDCSAQANDTVTVHYDPLDPSRATGHSHLRAHGLLRIIGGGAVAAAGLLLGVFILAVWRASRRDDPAVV